MKAVRLFSVALALALFVVAVLPVAPQPAAALTSQTTTLVTSPAQAFMDAARGLSLLAPMSVTAPLITLKVESAGVSGYACTLVKQSPKDYSKMKTRQSFDMQWTIQNTGDHIWYANWVPFKYIWGAKMQTHGNTFSLPGDIQKGKKANLVVDMEAPKNQGIYSTTWGLFANGQAFCRVTLTIGVSK